MISFFFTLQWMPFGAAVSIKYLSPIFAAIIAIFFSDYIVELLFERQKFTTEDSYTVSSIQKILLVYAPFTVCGMVLVNFLTSINKNSFMAYLAFGSMILNFILDFWLVKEYGLFGIAICTSCIYIIRSIVLFKYTVNQKNK